MYSKVYVEILNICNMSCSFCHGHNRAPCMMNREEFSYVLDKLSGKTKYIYYHLMGEPLLHPNLSEFLDIAQEKGYKSIITTNGTLLNEHGEMLIKSLVHKVSISVHSFENGNEENFTEYMNKICNFSKKASNAGIIVVLRLWNKGCDAGLNDRVFDFLQNNIEGEWEKNTRGIRIRDKLHLEWGERFEWPDMNNDKVGEETTCYGLRDHFGILCDGTVVPCCLDSEGTINLGNIFKDDIDDILNAPRAKAMVEGFNNKCAVEELCKRCEYAQRFI